MVSLDADVVSTRIVLVVGVTASAVVVSTCTVLVASEEHEAIKILVRTKRLRKAFIVCTFQ
jgi:hypothetical protein